MAVITGDGVEIQMIEEAITDNTESYKEITGDVDVAPSSASGELIAITSETDVRNQQTVADAFTQNTVTDATETNLDNVALIKNQERRVDQKSVVYVKLTGANGTIVPAGTIFVCSTNSEEFLSDYAVTVASGEAYVSATSTNNAVTCPAETIGLKAPITDITSATNQTDAEVGFDEESDGTLRTRLQLIGSPYTNNVKEGLYLALTEIPNVSKISILDNNTDAPIDGVPARNFSPVVLGGNRAEVAKTIFRYMGVGNPSYGDVSQLMTSDITGDTYTIAFNNPSELLTVVAVTLIVDSDFNAGTGYDIVADNIVEYFNSLEIGEDLLIQKVEAVCLIEGVTTATVLLNGGSVNLTSTFKELFVTNLSNVTVV